MNLWRLSRRRSLDGRGGLYAPARWHTQGHRIVYTAESVAGVILEVLAHFEVDDEDVPDDYLLIRIELPKQLKVEHLDISTLPANWSENETVTQGIGDAWLESKRSAALRVPSVIAPETWNVIINPLHPSARRLKLVEARRFSFDQRIVAWSRKV